MSNETDTTLDTETTDTSATEQTGGGNENTTVSTQDVPAGMSPAQYKEQLAAFEGYAAKNASKRPVNFKTNKAWFDSLLHARAEYTKSKQALAKAAAAGFVVDTGDVIAPIDNTTETETETKETTATETTAEAKPAAVDTQGMLQIPDKPVVEAPKTPAEKPATTATEAEWQAWTQEYLTKGELGAETMAIVKAKTNLPDAVLQNYFAGEKAKNQMAYATAAQEVGGKEVLDAILGWAQNSLDKNEMVAINTALKSPVMWKIALSGLHARYLKANPAVATAAAASKQPTKQPQNNANVTNKQGAPGVVPYKTRAEYYKERGDPRYGYDAKYRNAVDARLLKSPPLLSLPTN